MSNLDTKKKMIQTKKGQRSSPKTEFKRGNIPWWIKRGLPHPSRDPAVIDKIKSYRLKQKFPKKDTVIETKLREALRREGFIFETYYPIIGQPDIAFPERKVAVFCDGCYWHGCPVCGYDTLRPNHDERVTSQLEGKGWTVLRFWEHEINEDEKECVRRIGQVLG
jgi:DNA mismatch endonuclease (patch repair protein)